MASDFSDEQLRRRYLDWCSTQVARRFLELSLDEIWLRWDLAASLPLPPDPSPAPLSSLLTAARIPSYLELVRRTTLLLAREMNLPSYEEWSERYLANPAEYNADLMGS